MPYINKVDRPKMDEVINFMIEKKAEPNGKLNYVLYKLCKIAIRPGYNNYKNYIGELQECIAEIRRTLLGPYEDQKKASNGGIE